MREYEWSVFDAIFQPKPHPAPLFEGYLHETILDYDTGNDLMVNTFLAVIRCINLPSDIPRIDGFFPEDSAR